MKTFEIQVKHVEFGVMEIEAENESEAQHQVDDVYMNGGVNWGDDTPLEVISIVEVK